MHILGILVSVRSCEKQVIYVLLATRIKLPEVLIASFPYENDDSIS